VLYGPVVLSNKVHTGLTAVQPYKLEGDRAVPYGQPISIAE
jgi:hypothetical protein